MTPQDEATHVDPMIGSADLNGYITSANAAFAGFYGHAPDDIIGRHWPGLAEPDDVAAVTGALIRSEGGDEVAVEFRARRCDGRLAWLRMIVTAERDHAGQTIGYRGVAEVTSITVDFRGDAGESQTA